MLGWGGWKPSKSELITYCFDLIMFLKMGFQELYHLTVPHTVSPKKIKWSRGFLHWGQFFNISIFPYNCSRFFY